MQSEKTTLLLVTVLGTGHYCPVVYEWQDGRAVRRYETDLFPLALVDWLQPDSVLVLLTPEAATSQHWERLQTELGPRVSAVAIPSGRTESELWELFSALESAVPEGVELVLDVTHGFRSLPLFAAVAALLLRRLRGVHLRAILYGAYEARDKERNVAPVFDLTTLVDLADWLSGIEAFERSGDGRLLAQRLRELHGTAYRHRGNQLPQHLARIASQLESFSEAVRLNRPLDALASADKLRARLADANAELERWARPFALLAAGLAAELRDLAHPRPKELDEANLRAQLALIEYALEKGLVLQAVTLAREWLVSWELARYLPERSDRWTSREAREEAEGKLNKGAQALKDGSSVATQLADRELYELWSQLADLRNDLAHGGMRESPRRTERVLFQVKQLVSRLRALVEGSDRSPD